MSKTILINDSINYNTEHSNLNNSSFIDTTIYNSLIFYKNKIDQLDNTKIWDRAKKLSNKFELIHLPNKRNKKDSIALYEPLSRSYFKMWEILSDFKILLDENNKNIMCLAEGPGGFMESINNYRPNINDKIYGITLKSTNKEVPGWKKSKFFLQNNDNIEITYGEDNTGNLYNINNIIFLKNKFKKKIYLVTAYG